MLKYINRNLSIHRKQQIPMKSYSTYTSLVGSTNKTTSDMANKNEVIVEIDNYEESRSQPDTNQTILIKSSQNEISDSYEWIKHTLIAHKNSFNHVTYTSLHSTLDYLYQQIFELKGTNKTLENVNEKLIKRICSQPQESLTQNKTYADVCRANNPPPIFSKKVINKEPIIQEKKPFTYNILIYPMTPTDQEDKSYSSLNTFNNIKKYVNPSSLCLSVNPKFIKNNGISLQCKTPEARTKLHKCLMEQNTITKKHNIIIPETRNPRIILHKVPTEIQQTEILHHIFTQNIDIKNNFTDFQEFCKTASVIRPIMKTYGTNTTDWILEVTPVTRNLLIKIGKLYIQWTIISLEDFIEVRRCFKCQDYGHIARNCTSKLTYCPHCAGQHDSKTCPNLDKQAKCINCSRHNKIRPLAKNPYSTDHKAYSNSCPILIKYKTILSSRVQYLCI
jgi:hypothetical protein